MPFEFEGFPFWGGEQCIDILIRGLAKEVAFSGRPWTLFIGLKIRASAQHFSSEGEE
jgi:hypothetical protein